MSIFLEVILAYLINLASSERSSAIAASRERKLKEAFEKEEALKKALASARSIRDEVHATCIELSRDRNRLGVTQQEEPVWRLLADEVFQNDLAEWLMAGAIEEGNAAKERLVQAMERAISDANGTPEQLDFLKSAYFDALEKSVFANPILGRWRHQLSLDYLREQVVLLRELAESAAGIFSREKQEAALDSYCEKALAAWDIIDLSNLPEGDIHMATQKLLLRQLYMPLRIEVEHLQQGESDEAVLARMEEEREARRHREAGHFTTEEPDLPDRRKSRVPVGERLATTRRLVVLGDPGGGKTTMLRWMATAYLLKHKGDDTFSKLPDTQTLPEESWIPVLIRCRDLGEQDLCRSFTDFLTQHLNKSELLPEDAEVMRAVILDRIAKGEAILLVDGLDEITNPRVRMMFCQELERTAARYPEAPIVVTSRIVGYRDMPYRMGSGFEHGQIAELDDGDKEHFAHRWVEITEQHQTTDEKAKRAQELLDALHSNNRIERLTGNPMLLTTLALVKRKVGKLPNKCSKLYAEAVSVLLNWNPRLYETIEEDEAIPQLEYLAYEMCRRGVQRLTDDEVLDLLDRLRVEYPNIRAIKRRDPHAFLTHLEERSSILIKSGGIWQQKNKQEKQVWEFRHLTFQEYLAASALLDGRYPGRDKTRRSLSEHIAPLAGQVSKQKVPLLPDTEPEFEVTESWREALRLVAAECNDDDVNEVLLAILNPAPGEDNSMTQRPRVVLAALCLADEPNADEETASTILDYFVAQVRESDAGGRIRTSLGAAAVELGRCIWAESLKRRLMREFLRRSPRERHPQGGIWAMVEAMNAPEATEAFEVWFAALVPRLKSNDDIERASAALVVMESAFLGKARLLPGLIEGLMTLLPLEPPLRFASAWALGWLCKPSPFQGDKEIWRPSDSEAETLTEILGQTSWDESDTVRWLMRPLGHSEAKCDPEPVVRLLEHGDPHVRRSAAETIARIGDKRAFAPLLARLDDADKAVRQAVIGAMMQLDDKQTVVPLLARLDDSDTDVRLAVIDALAQLGDKQAVAPLLARLDDPDKAVLLAVVRALGQLGDKQAVVPLLEKLGDKNVELGASVAAALHVLGEQSHLARFLESANFKVRGTAVHAYSRQRDDTDRLLLSRDLDAVRPWLGPQSPVTEGRVGEASSRLGITMEEIRSRYESMAIDLKLKLSWKEIASSDEQT